MPQRRHTSRMIQTALLAISAIAIWLGLAIQAPAFATDSLTHFRSESASIDHHHLAPSPAHAHAPNAPTIHMPSAHMASAFVEMGTVDRQVAANDDTCPRDDHDHHAGHIGCCGALGSCVSGCSGLIPSEGPRLFLGAKRQPALSMQWHSAAVDTTPIDPPPRTL